MIHQETGRLVFIQPLLPCDFKIKKICYLLQLPLPKCTQIIWSLHALHILPKQSTMQIQILDQGLDQDFSNYITFLLKMSFLYIYYFTYLLETKANKKTWQKK